MLRTTTILPSARRQPAIRSPSSTSRSRKTRDRGHRLCHHQKQSSARRDESQKTQELRNGERGYDHREHSEDAMSYMWKITRRKLRCRLSAWPGRDQRSTDDHHRARQLLAIEIKHVPERKEEHAKPPKILEEVRVKEEEKRRLDEQLAAKKRELDE